MAAGDDPEVGSTNIDRSCKKNWLPPNTPPKRDHTETILKGNAAAMAAVHLAAAMDLVDPAAMAAIHLAPLATAGLR